MRIATPVTLALALATSILAPSIFAASDAHADRRYSDRRCEVTFVRVPDDVRLVIESWLKAEPRCTGTIELRVVPTDAGTFYLVAQRPDGRIHEREVPDAQSAGVLVASWVADDWTSTERDVEERPPVVSAPGMVMETPSVVAAVPPPARPSSEPGKWATLGIMFGPDPDKDGGFHLDIDLIRRGNWTFGVTGEYAESSSDGMPFTDQTWVHTSDWRLLAKVARTFRLADRVLLSAVAGLGIVHTETTITSSMTTSWETVYQDVPMESAVAEIGATVTREIFDSWALTAGPKLTYTEQSHYLYDGSDVERPPFDFVVLFGVRYRL